MKYEKYNLEEMNVDKYFDLSLESENGQGVYSLKSIDNDTFHIYGKMNNSANTW